MRKIMGLAVALALIAPLQAAATTTVYEVKALDNSTSGGAGLAISVFASQSFSVSADINDLWNAGPLPRWSNADGLNAVLLSTGLPDVNGDNSNVAAGNKIGDVLPLWTQNGLTAPYGTLVGQWGSGDYFTVGTTYTGTAIDNTLNLFYFDSNTGGNRGSILASVTAIPEPETYAMLLAGLGLVGFIARRRKAA
ncbi:MAG: PEP-CTERM sorting domain-containing protein [Nitrosospira sp.]|nr:PEP-CTERM sorting domain-containing protein [Nitrosospira sp.]